jgi:hypothetical protein
MMKPGNKVMGREIAKREEKYDARNGDKTSRKTWREKIRRE